MGLRSGDGTRQVYPEGLLCRGSQVQLSDCVLIAIFFEVFTLVAIPSTLTARRTKFWKSALHCDIDKEP